MNFSRFLLEMIEITNHARDVGESDNEIYQLAHQTL